MHEENFAILSGIVWGSLTRVTFEKRPEGVRPGNKHLQTAGTASAKALKWERVWNAREKAKRSAQAEAERAKGYHLMVSVGRERGPDVGLVAL